MHYPKHLQQVGSGGGAGGFGSDAASAMRAHDVETQNDDLVKGLSQKVRLLKDVSCRPDTGAPRHGVPDLTRHVTDTRPSLCAPRPQITVNIGNEVRDSTKMLSGMVSSVRRTILTFEAAVVGPALLQWRTTS